MRVFSEFSGYTNCQPPICAGVDSDLARAGLHIELAAGAGEAGGLTARLSIKAVVVVPGSKIVALTTAQVTNSYALRFRRLDTFPGFWRQYPQMLGA